MMSFPLSALADIVMLDLPQADPEARALAEARQAQLTKPPGSLGRLEDLALFMASWQKTERPRINRAQALVFAGNHGVCAQGVNPFPQAVTALMVANFNHGGAAINQLCTVAGADLSVVPLMLDQPTQDITQGPAITQAECLDALNTGAAAVDPSADVLILGEMGIGNSTISAALALGLIGGEAAQWVGAGTGSDAEGVALKTRVIAQAVARHAGLGPLELLAALGGREQAALCGAVLAARLARIPVILDGYICTAAVAALHVARPDALAHCLVGHQSREPGHARLCTALGKEPVMALDMALGEGTGAALALTVLRGALACHNGMASFAEAGISA
ncbi:MAG: nicotinate-nucleotide--dimethylbenzimidazole phosphoribosyltransferase [Rhodobacteraceae bacterium]|nr:nicotinate-nucleotide--dimethylbenzimidazole phosphoribosyltransferase [Paracoccaceae bacterium]